MSILHFKMFPFNLYLFVIITLSHVNMINVLKKGPLILTPYIESNCINYARKLCRVKEMINSDITDVESYSGFLTVDKRYDSNLFFWFILSMVIYFYFISILTLLSLINDEIMFYKM